MKKLLILSYTLHMVFFYLLSCFTLTYFYSLSRSKSSKINRICNLDYSKCIELVMWRVCSVFLFPIRANKSVSFEYICTSHFKYFWGVLEKLFAWLLLIVLFDSVDENIYSGNSVLGKCRKIVLACSIIIL